jgi:hypothetical protein
MYRNEQKKKERQVSIFINVLCMCAYYRVKYQSPWKRRFIVRITAGERQMLKLKKAGFKFLISSGHIKAKSLKLI